jgi:hypothetical protein
MSVDTVRVGFGGRERKHHRVTTVGRKGLSLARGVMILFTLLLALACDSTSPTEQIAGTYDLETRNGQAAEGFMILAPDGDWSWLTPTGEIVFGTWSREGSILTFLAFEPPTVIKATLSGEVLTFSDNGSSYVFRR